MQALDKFIVRIPQKYKDKIKMGDVELDLVSKFQEFENRFMHSEVVALPKRYEDEIDVKVGDTLYVHHNIVMGDYFNFQDDLYLVAYRPEGYRVNLGHAYKNEEGIHMIDHWVFLEPMESSKKVQSSVLEIVQEDVPNDRGRIWAGSPKLEEMGLKPGDVVYFSKDSDYEMEIDGTKVWRMLTSDLMYAEVKE